MDKLPLISLKLRYDKVRLKIIVSSITIMDDMS